MEVRLIEEEPDHHSRNANHRFPNITNITYTTLSTDLRMSSPKSAPPSSDITRQHTPADGSVNGDEGDDAEEQLPEKVCGSEYGTRCKARVRKTLEPDTDCESAASFPAVTKHHLLIHHSTAAGKSYRGTTA